MIIENKICAEAMDNPRFVRSLGHYGRLPNTIRGIFQRKDITVGELTFDTWAEMVKAMKYCDYYLDGESDSEKRYTLGREMLGKLSDNQQFDHYDRGFVQIASSFSERFNLHGEVQKRIFLAKLSLLFGVTERLRHTPDATSFARLVAGEGQITAQLFLCFIDPQLHEKSGYHEAATFIKHLGRAGNLVDGVIDLRKDYRSGEIQISPTLRNYAQLLRHSVCEGVSVLAMKGMPLYNLADATKRTFED